VKVKFEETYFQYITNTPYWQQPYWAYFVRYPREHEYVKFGFIQIGRSTERPVLGWNKSQESAQ
jgi:hypothetical protein